MNSSVSQLTHNVRVYGWIRMFMMRVYLPLVAIYLVEVGHLSLAQLGILGSIAAITSLVLNVPTGYLADKWTRKAAIMTGATALALGSLIYALFPSFKGAIVATFAEAMGYAIISGAGEAMMHDTLLAMGRADHYVQTVGRAQAFGLTGNIVLVGLVPLTYGVNKHLPFLLGTLASVCFLCVASTLIEPPRPKHATQASTHSHTILRVLRVFVSRRTILVFIALGLLSSMYKTYPPYVNLALKDLGLSPNLLGFLFAAASVVGAINGRLAHHFKRLTFLQYSLFDVAIGASFLLAVGITRNMVVAIVAFIINMGFWRIRSIMYQDQLLRRFGGHHHKATLISTMGFFESINFWQGPAFAALIAWLGYYHGFIVMAGAVVVVVGSLFVVGIKLFTGSESADAVGSY